MRSRNQSSKTGFGQKLGRRDFFKAMGFGVMVGRSHLLNAQNQQSSKLISGKIPHAVPGKLSMSWANDAMLREAADLHPFDLQGRMRMAVNAMTSCVDPNRGYVSYSPIFFRAQPPMMFHHVGDFVDDMGRHTDALWMIRNATGHHHNDEVVKKMAENAMDVVDGGIAWNPPDYPYLAWWPEAWGPQPRSRYTQLPEGSRVILGLVSFYRATGNQRARETVRSMVHRHYQIAQKNEKYLWYPDQHYLQVGDDIVPARVLRGASINVKDPRSSGTGDMGGNIPAGYNGMLLLPVMRYYEDTKDSVAAEFAIKFSRVIVDLMPDFSRNIGHTHSALATISGIFKVGQVLQISEFTDWAEKAYQEFVSRDYIPRFGWTPEAVGRPRKKGHLCVEACATTDYLELALQLALYGHEKYWDHVERIAMNQLLEGQLLSIDFVERFPSELKRPRPDLDPKWLANMDSTWITREHVLQRSLGGFGIGSGPNDWIQVGQGATTLQCCFGSGARGLYDVWYHAAQEDSDTIKVNLQFSKRLPSALIISKMPGTAALEIKLSDSKKLLVRKPEWAAPEGSRIFINEQEQKVGLRGSYFDLGLLDRGTAVRIEFANHTTLRTEAIGEVTFTNLWRGNAVVEMQPTGEIYPLYQGRNRQEGAMPLPYVSRRPVNPL